jgi:hypothetical protein
MILVALALAMLIPHLAATPQIAGAEIDTVAPTPPADFHVVSRTKSNMITLGWTPSYDAVGVAGYRLYRNGSWQGTLYQAGVDLLGPVMYDRLGGRIKTAVTYELIAFDAAGNDSTPATLEVAP